MATDRTDTLQESAVAVSEIALELYEKLYPELYDRHNPVSACAGHVSTAQHTKAPYLIGNVQYIFPASLVVDRVLLPCVLAALASSRL